MNPLLGEAPDPEFVEELKQEVLKYENITGVHDLIIHNYGPGRKMASIHAEVPCDISIVEIHEIIDRAENEISKKLNIFLVIHMDPINTDDEEINRAKIEISKILKNFQQIKSFHDFRIVGEGEHKNLIFDVVVDFSSKFTHEDGENLKSNIYKEIKKLHPKYNAFINIDRDYT